MLTSKSSAAQRAKQVFRVEVHRCQQKSIDTLVWDVVDLFFLRGNLTPADVQRIGRELLADPVTETFTDAAPDDAELAAGYAHTIDVTLLPGVTDSVAESP